MIKAGEPRSIIYAVIAHEVYSALSRLTSWRGWLPNQYLRHIRPLTRAGKPSGDGSTAEFRVVDLITQHDVSADEQFPGGSYLGLWPAAPLRQPFVETLSVFVITNRCVHSFHQQVAQ